MKMRRHLRWTAVISAAAMGLGTAGLSSAEQQAGITEMDPLAAASQATGAVFCSKIEPIPGGEIDWTAGIVRAVGIGKARPDLTGRQAELMAKRGAYIVAARNAALVLAGVRVGPGGRFENVRHGWIRADVTLSGFREREATYDPATRTATARMELPLWGIRGAVGVLGLRGQPNHKTSRALLWPESPAGAAPCDMILLDARRVDCRPGVLPRVVSADGQCVFDAASLAAGGPLRRPPARYAVLEGTVRLPPRSERAGVHCLTVRAVRVESDGAVVLHPDDLRLLTGAPGAREALQRGHLLIVMDK